MSLKLVNCTHLKLNATCRNTRLRAYQSHEIQAKQRSIKVATIDKITISGVLVMADPGFCSSSLFVSESVPPVIIIMSQAFITQKFLQMRE